MPTLLLLVHAFLTAVAIVVGKAAREGVALAVLSPAQMAALDALTFVIVLAGWAAHVRFGSERAPIRAMVAGALTLAVGDLLLAADWPFRSSTTHAVATYLWLSVQASFSAAHAAALLSRVARAQPALSPIAAFGTVSVLGWLAGGMATRAVAGTLGVPPLVAAVAFLTVLAVAVAALGYWRLALLQGHALSREPMAKATRDVILKSRPLMLLAGLAVFSAAVSSLVTFQFRAAVSSSMADAAGLAAFFGAFNVWAGGIALAVHVIGAPLCRRLTRSAHLIIGPLAIVVTSSAVLATGGLAAAVVLRGSEQVIRYSLDRAALERLYWQVPDGQLVAGRTFIETSLVRLGDVLGTAVALLIVLGMRLSFTWLSLPILLLAFGSVYLALRARHLPTTVDR